MGAVQHWEDFFLSFDEWDFRQVIACKVACEELDGGLLYAWFDFRITKCDDIKVSSLPETNRIYHPISK